MWPFKKKMRDISLLPDATSGDGDWSLSMLGGDEPLIIRLNESAEAWASHNELPIKLGFAIPLNNPIPGGLPDPDENRGLAPVEDLIADKVQQASQCIHVMTNTSGVMKEFVFYITEGVDIKSLHDAVNDAVPSHEVQCIAEREPKWQTFKSLKKLASQGQRVS